MRSIAVIPARLASTRFPRKILIDLCGRPMLWHVWDRTRQASGLDAVIVATDSDEVAQAVKAWGGEVLLTSEHCRTGTDRIASVLDQLVADFIVNVQGDEPLICPELIESLIRAAQDSERDIYTPVFRLTREAQLSDSNLVKVARAIDGRALYFSRSPIPFVRDVPQEQWLGRDSFWGHVGVYGYRRDVLRAYLKLPKGCLENSEQLEQLRLLEAGYEIETVESQYEPISVDVPADLETVRAALTTNQRGLLWNHQGNRSVDVPAPKIVSKVWGVAEHLVVEPRFQLDRISVRRGGYCSWHYHQHTVNGFVVLQGALLIEWEEAGTRRQQFTTPETGFIAIASRVHHRFIGMEADTIALELYTPFTSDHLEPNDIERLSPGGLDEQLGLVDLIPEIVHRS